MIKITIGSNNKHVTEISINGHAMYDDFGKDIVCAAVSTCVITSVNGISSIDDAYLKVDNTSDGLYITIRKENDICDKLINNMISLLEELKSQYPKNIKIIK